MTVVSTQGFYVSDEEAELVAFSETGRVLYYNSTYRVYFDVDPVPGTQYTVEYLASKHLNGDDCRTVRTERCTYNVYKRLNLSTGEEREIYGEVTPQIFSGRWHDVDRINETHVAIADILRDSVRVVNTTSDETVWEWNASSYFPPNVGGAEGDWSHINDVEVLDDGRFTVGVRNMDRVVFVEPGEGVQSDWTLGEENNYSILYEQHNPDYIPASRGGPAITVADSENSRVLEYQRQNGSWTRSWGWHDSRLQWPRDADRLPSGNTLVSDTHGDRVAEVAPNGTVVWSVTVGMPYEAERLGTGDESAGGQSMQELRGSPGTITHRDRGIDSSVWLSIKRFMPSLPVNGALYAGPSWVRFAELSFIVVAVLSLLTWCGFEIRWSRYGFRTSARKLVGRFI
ncbi:arylsulfotransferase (asst) [Halosimplex aquaticum]|uniref:Arylsulfotransferase (Asst) n=1 Tax=Halosimplex aquaticum TaxID=3026162 RepID=A0ABD5Y2N5_9EURY|nr:hypothetical protein [Halosimplex aquaticum]